MTGINSKLMNRLCYCLCAAAVTLGTTACSHLVTIRPMPSNGYVALDAQDTVNVMRAGGFSEKDIARIGLDLRNTLAQNGGAALGRGDAVEAVMACQPPFVHITTHSGKMLVYNTKTKTLQ